MENTVNLNHNAAECIKSASSFGYTTFTNICNGTTTRVDWGALDWFLTLAGVSLIGAFALTLLIGLMAFISEIY